MNRIEEIGWNALDLCGGSVVCVARLEVVEKGVEEIFW